MERNVLVRAKNVKSGQRHMAMTHIIIVIAKIAIGAMKCEGREKGRHKGKGKCASCESSTHKRSSHRDCLFNKRRAKKETSSGSSTESDGEVSSDDS